MAMTAKDRRDALAAAKAKATEQGQPTEIERLNQAQFTSPGAKPASGPALEPTRTRTYVVGCKLGVRSIALQHTPLIDKDQMGNQGMRSVKEAIRTGETLVLRGTSYPRGTVPEGFDPPPMLTADKSTALNFGVNADWFDLWMEQNKRNPLVLNHIIFHFEKEADARAFAKEHTKEPSQLAALNPKGDSRIKQHAASTRAEVDEISRDDSRSASRRTVGTE